MASREDGVKSPDNLTVGVLRASVIGIGGTISKVTLTRHRRIRRKVILHLIYQLFEVASLLSISLVSCIKSKMLINRRKYKKELCLKENGAVRKYTMYGSTTGIYSDGDYNIILDPVKDASIGVQYLEFQNSYKSLQEEVTEFAKERNWLNKYNEQTLCMSLFSELGELSEVLQWEVANKDLKQINEEQVKALACELADIAIYSIHFLRYIGATDLQINSFWSKLSSTKS